MPTTLLTPTPDYMKEIAQVAEQLLRLLCRLVWLIMKLLFRWLSQAGVYLYRHRIQIIGYKYTPVIVLLVCTLWFTVTLIRRNTAEDSLPQPASYGPQTIDPVLVREDSDFTDNKPDAKASKRLISSIYSWLGTPHSDGGNTKAGIDCSGFVQAVAREVYGIQLKRNAAEIYEYNTVRISRQNLREGDLVFFRMDGHHISHVGIYLKNNAFAHASTSKGVTISSLDEPYYAKTFYQAGRLKTITL
ncbi:MAG: NlpC/P60 family protein [Bacteroidota bacterium]